LLKRIIKLLRPSTAKPDSPAGQTDVRSLMARHTVEEFNEGAENYFKRNAGNTAFY